VRTAIGIILVVATAYAQITLAHSSGDSPQVTCVEASPDIAGSCVEVSTEPLVRASAVLGDSNWTAAPTGIVHEEPCGTGARTWEGNTQIDDRIMQSYTGRGGVLSRIDLRLSEQELTNGTAVLRVYRHAGTYGVSSAPVGAVPRPQTPTPGWIAESEPIRLTATSMQPGTNIYSFSFIGLNRLPQPVGRPFLFSVDWRPIGPNSNARKNTFGMQFSGPMPNTHPGNAYQDGACPTVPSVTGLDLLFRVWEDR